MPYKYSSRTAATGTEGLYSEIVDIQTHISVKHLLMTVFHDKGKIQDLVNHQVACGRRVFSRPTERWLVVEGCFQDPLSGGLW